MATVSLSKGVFAFKRTSSKYQKVSSGRSDTWLQASLQSDARFKKLAFSSYKGCLNSATQKIQEVLQAMHTQVFDDLITFIHNNGAHFDNASFDEFSKKDIPTACLVTGVNMPDHDAIFANLTSLIKGRITPHVAQISSSDCGTIKGMIQKLVRSFIESPSLNLAESEEDEEVEPTQLNKSLKRTQCNMNVLSAWYRDAFQTNPSTLLNGKGGQRTPQKTSKSRPFSAVPLVVIVEDVEGIHPRVLQDFVLICSEYERSLPFVFILGVSTTPQALHRALNQDASACIAIETFQAQPSSNVLSQIVEKVMMTSTIPFHVGGRVFKLLLDIFLYHNLSVNNFISGYKYCMLEHFLYGDSSYLCTEPHIRKAMILSFDDERIDKLKNIPSFAAYLDSLEEKSLPKSTQQFKDMIFALIEELELWYSDFCVLVRVLFTLAKNLPKHPLGRHVRESFMTCLMKPIKESEEFQETWQLLSISARNELLPRVEQSIDILRDRNPESSLSQLFSSLSVFYDKLKNMDLCSDTMSESAKVIPFEIKPTDRFQLREKLLEAAKQKHKRENPYDVLRTEILSIYEHWFILYLRPITKPLHEVFFFDSLSSVKYQLLGPLRATITTGLSNPQKYLQCSCCKLEKASDISPSLPDLSIIYKLHLECGTYINLYDLLQAFIAVVGEDNENSDSEPEEKKPKKSKKRKTQRPTKKKAVDQHLQARFVQAVSELQLLGFVKPTKRKTDHIQRLTWNGS